MFRTLVLLAFAFSTSAFAQDKVDGPPILDHIVVKSSVNAKDLVAGSNDRTEVGHFKDYRDKRIAVTCKMASAKTIDCVLMGNNKEHSVKVDKSDSVDVRILVLNDKTQQAIRIKEIHLHLPGIDGK